MHGRPRRFRFDSLGWNNIETLSSQKNVISIYTSFLYLIFDLILFMNQDMFWPYYQNYSALIFSTLRPRLNFVFILFLECSRWRDAPVAFEALQQACLLQPLPQHARRNGKKGPQLYTSVFTLLINPFVSQTWPIKP